MSKHDEYEIWETCWQCDGAGHMGSACWDDLCAGGDVPCRQHGDVESTPCDLCCGRGSYPIKERA